MDTTNPQNPSNPYGPPAGYRQGGGQGVGQGVGQDYRGSGVKAIATPDGQALGGLGFRLLARIIDGIVIQLIAAVAGYGILERASVVSSRAIEFVLAGRADDAAALLNSPTLRADLRSLTFVLLAVSAVYTILPLKFYGATPGKLICGLRVRHWERPGHPSWAQAILRWVTSDGISQIAPVYRVLDYLWPCWDRRRQALHDKLGATVVVRR
ncbi:MAG: RDD family protein [Janthinobacterium lividum]